MLDPIVIVEDHGLMASTVAAALRGQGVEVTVVRPEADEHVIEAVLASKPQLVLLDLDLAAAGDATPLVRPLVEAQTTVLMVTGVDDPVRRARCIAEGAAGVVDKALGFDDLVAAIEAVGRDGNLLSEPERHAQLELVRRHERAQREALAPFKRFTGREAEVLGELIAGRTVDQIAADAVVSLATVRTQVRAILSKLEVSSQVAAIGRARAAGWEPPQERG